jgi:EAL and modified HD-GYP domain-containing signal transduction protein
MCEELCIAAELNACEAFFMTGLLSMIDVLLRQPLRDAVSMLPLGEHIRGALLEHAGPLGEALLCARRYEEGAFSDAAFMGLPGEVVSEIYRKAVGWADSAWRTTGGSA